MESRIFFNKRFSIGLALDTTLAEFDAMLDEYSWAIENIYFSLPMGDKFHARTRVVSQMRQPETVALFWELLKCIKAHDIKLELVLNNGHVCSNDIDEVAQMLAEHNIGIDLVGITDDIYDDVKRYFPTQKIVYSFKNHTHTKTAFASLSHTYDEIVLGRQNIRNVELFRYIHDELKTKVVLLLNNGCSHVCGGCTTLDNCHRSYYQEKFSKSSEYLYALQSVMPFELHSELLDVSHVDLFKISSRNASVDYIRKCLDSYINCIENPYIQQSKENYTLWSRLAWHGEYHADFSLDSIRKIKRQIYQGVSAESIDSKINIIFDMRNQFVFPGCKIPDLNCVEQNLGKVFPRIPLKVSGYLIGVSNCSNLLEHISLEQLEQLLSLLTSTGRDIYFSLPPQVDTACQQLDPLWKVLRKWACLGDLKCIVVNSFTAEHFIKENLGIPVAVGERITNPTISTEENEYLNGNETGFGNNIVTLDIRERYSQDNFQFLLCTMPRNGLCISAHESMAIQAVIGMVEEYTDICHHRGNEKCDGSCINSLYSVLNSENGAVGMLCANSIYQKQRITQGIRKTVVENRCGVVIPFMWEELI